MSGERRAPSHRLRHRPPAGDIEFVGRLLQPVIAALLAAVLPGEARHAPQIAGGIMMPAGIGKS